MTRHLFFALVSILTLLISACAPLDRSAEGPSTINIANSAQWDQLLATWIEDAGDPTCDAPGGVLLVETADGRYLKAAGLTNPADGVPVEVDDRFEIGSNTKSFTVVLALQLQEAGALSMDDLLIDWLPDTTAQIPNGDQVTLRQLAGNTSGIWDYADPLMQPLIDNNDQEGMATSYTPDELINYAITNGTPDFAPGADWNYSSTNFILLGQVVEAASGQSLPDLYRQRIFDPLGMENSSYLTDSPAQGSIVSGYYTIPSGEQIDVTNWNTSQGGAAGAIVSTAEDMAAYAEGLFEGELFQNKTTLAEMLDFTPLSIDQGGGVIDGYGLGIMSYATADNGFSAIGHGGQTPGFQSVWFYVPEADSLVIFLTNSGSCPADFLPFFLTPDILGLEASADLFDGLPSYPLAEPDYRGKRQRDFSAFEDALAGLAENRIADLDSLLADATLLDLQDLMDDGQFSAEELVTYYVERIQRYDLDKLNSVLELNPEALAIARQLDAERAAGTVRSPMHGIPVLLKDNIATDDGLHAAAGAWAMRDWQPSRDAFLVAQLRDAGAIILGKANLSEWANYMDVSMPSGFSVLGGQTRNPYGPFDTLGSSSGSAVAVAANLAAVTVGTETQGSIIQPAVINGVVGLKTSRGLVSRDHILPLVDWMDVPGPIGRSVTDVAVLLSAMTGVDQNDPATLDAAEVAATGYTQYLVAEAAAGTKLGIVVQDDASIDQLIADFEMEEDDAANFRVAMQQVNDGVREQAAPFADLGITLVEIPAAALPDTPDLSAVIDYGFHTGLDAFLANLGDEAPVMSLAEIVAINAEDPANRAPYGQGHLESAVNSDLSAEAYAAQVAESMSVADDLRALFAEYDLDALLDTSQVYAAAGFPALTVPAGYDESGQPVGVTLIGDFLGEDKLITIGYAFEQATLARIAPDLESAIAEIDGLSE